MRKQLLALCAILSMLAAFPGISEAGIISVPNGDFETAPPDPNLDNDNNYLTGDVTNPPWNADGRYLAVREAFTNPSSFVAGWSSNGPAGTNGKYGLQQPDYRSDSGTGRRFYARVGGPGGPAVKPLVGPFDGNLIGFVNLDDADGFDQEIQSEVLGNLQPGQYILNVAVGARAGSAGTGGGPQDWNDIKYDISLVANPLPPVTGFGSTGGIVLGTPASVTLVPFTAVADGTNITDVQYILNVPGLDPNIGAPYAVRIRSRNNFTQNGVPDPNAPINGGTNARFAQGNFDNVRLQYIPEPSSLVLLAVGAIFAFTRAPRHRL